MTYEEWFLKQGELHANVMKKLTDKSVDEIIDEVIRYSARVNAAIKVIQSEV